MALADLALQMTGWNTVVPDLIGRYENATPSCHNCDNIIEFRFKQDMSTVSVLLDVLIVLPEEVRTYVRFLSHPII